MPIRKKRSELAETPAAEGEALEKEAFAAIYVTAGALENVCKRRAPRLRERPTRAFANWLFGYEVARWSLERELSRVRKSSRS